MSLAAALAADGMRPASSLPTITCSNCGDEIEILNMGDHACAKAPPSPSSAHSSVSITNPYTLRPSNVSDTKPVQPSPLQFDSPPAPPPQYRPPPQPQPQQQQQQQQYPPPQPRPRAPTAGSGPRGPRIPLPKINPDTANRPFLGPLPDAPASPTSSLSSGGSNVRRAPLRSMTSPMPRLYDPRPPSPELSANLDCAFPPFPTAAATSSGRKSSAGSERSGSRAGPRTDFYGNEPKSPMTADRMNTHKNGPFDPSRRRPSNDRRPSERRPSQPTELSSNPLPPLPSNLAPITTTRSNPVEMPAGPTSPNPSQQQFPQRMQSERRVPPERPARPVEELPPALLNQLGMQPLSNVTPARPPPVPLQNVERSQTVPIPVPPHDEPPKSPLLMKAPSAPAVPTTMVDDSSLLETPVETPLEIQFPAPPQNNHRDESRADEENTPIASKSVQVSEPENLRRKSESGSSTASSAFSLRNSNSTSGPSPIGSAASSVDAFTAVAADSAQYGEEKGMRVPGLNVRVPQKPGLRAEQSKEKPPPINTAATLEPPRETAIPTTPPLEKPPSRNWPLESPMDPAMRNGNLGDERSNSPVPNSPIPSSPGPESPAESVPRGLAPGGLDGFRLSSATYDPFRAATPLPPIAAQQQREESPHGSKLNVNTDFQGFQLDLPSRLHTPVSSVAPSRSASPFSEKALSEQAMSPVDGSNDSGAEQLASLAAPPVPQDDGAPRPPLTRRGTTGGKSTCRGCNQQIEGKSVKAADGRLTGRWHKACFVCKTCEEPFTTADFYVINNQPFCEQHYHEKNGSLCHGCRRGIEGQYLETVTAGPSGKISRKYHRRCFTCVDCRMVLSDDYFEITGRIYCERHAFAAMRGRNRGPGGPGGPGRGPPPTPHGGSGLKTESLKAERRTTKMMTMGPGQSGPLGPTR